MLLALVCLMSLQAGAQSLERYDKYVTGYITTSSFDATNTVASIDGVLYMIYADMPIALVRYPANNPREEYEVPSTVQRICNNAFQGTKYLKTLKLHSEVTGGNYLSLSIGESAFNDSSIENFVVVENDDTAVKGLEQELDGARKEIARYDLQGREIIDTAEGVQIIRYDDNSARKVLKP